MLSTSINAGLTSTSEEQQGTTPKLWKVLSLSNGNVIVGHSPSRSDALRTTIGSVNINPGYHSLNDSITEFLSFGNSRSVSCSWPPTGGVAINKLGGFYQIVNGDIKSASPNLQHKDGSIISNIPVIGNVMVSYTTSYMELLYRPQLIGDTNHYGSIISVLDGNYTKFDVPIPDSPQERDRYLLAKVTRKVIIDKDGQWEWDSEFPDNYLDNNNKPDNESYAESAITVAEFVILPNAITTDYNKMGTLRPFRPKENTYFKPPTFFHREPAPKNEAFLSTYNNVSFDEMFRRAKSDFPTLTEE